MPHSITPLNQSKCLPVPRPPPVRLQEYGLPSSHTLNTLCLNYMFMWYLYDRQLIATGTAAVLYCLVALWVRPLAARCAALPPATCFA